VDSTRQYPNCCQLGYTDDKRERTLDIFEKAFVWHLFADWIFQSDWMARNKANYVPYPPKQKKEGDGPLFLIPHPAAWVHSGIHLLGLFFIFPWWMAIPIAITHLLIDLRFPLVWWRGFFKQTTSGDVALHVAIWGDQVCHITILAIATLIVAR